MIDRISRSTLYSRSNSPARVDKDLLDPDPDASLSHSCTDAIIKKGHWCCESAEGISCLHSCGFRVTGRQITNRLPVAGQAPDSQGQRRPLDASKILGLKASSTKVVQ